MTTTTKARTPKANALPVLDAAVDQAATVAEAATASLHEAEMAALEAAAAEAAEAEARAQAARVALAERQAVLGHALDRAEAERLEAERAAALERLAEQRDRVHAGRTDLTHRLDELIARTVAVAHAWAVWQGDHIDLRDLASGTNGLGAQLGEPGTGHDFERDTVLHLLARRDTATAHAVGVALPSLNSLAMATPPPGGDESVW